MFYRAHNMVWDQSLALILYGKGPVYVDPRLVSHHRSIVAEEAQITSLCMPNETIKSVTHGCTPVRKTTLSTSYTAAAHGFIRSAVCCSQRLSVLHVKARVKMIGKSIRDLESTTQKVAAGILDYHLGVEHFQAEDYKCINKAAE